MRAPPPPLSPSQTTAERSEGKPLSVYTRGGAGCPIDDDLNLVVRSRTFRISVAPHTPSSFSGTGPNRTQFAAAFHQFLSPRGQFRRRREVEVGEGGGQQRSRRRPNYDGPTANCGVGAHARRPPPVSATVASASYA